MIYTIANARDKRLRYFDYVSCTGSEYNVVLVEDDDLKKFEMYY